MNPRGVGGGRWMCDNQQLYLLEGSEAAQGQVLVLCQNTPQQVERGFDSTVIREPKAWSICGAAALRRPDEFPLKE